MDDLQPPTTMYNNIVVSTHLECVQIPLEYISTR